jgi:hypothetical protein
VIAAVVVIIGVAGALYPRWSPWLDIDRTPPLLLSIAYPVLGDKAQDRAYKRLVDLGDIELILFPLFEQRERKLTPFEMRRLVHISMHRVKDERLTLYEREDALFNLVFLGERAFVMQPSLTRVALDGGDRLHMLAGVLALLFAQDEQTMLRTRRRLAERASPPVALFASAFYIDDVNRKELLGSGEEHITWQLPQDWTHVTLRLERASDEERAEWVAGAIALKDLLESEDDFGLLDGIIELFGQFDLPTDELRMDSPGGDP